MRLRTLSFLFSLCACSDVDTPITSSEAPSESGSKDGTAPLRKDAGAARDAARPSSNGSAGAIGSSGDDDELCDVFKLATGRVTPDMLIVLDRSSSMKSREVNRWDPSVRGIKSITAALDEVVNFGLMSFPGSGGLSGGQGRSCAPGSLDVPIGANTSDAIAARLDQLELVDSTPTAAALDAAYAELEKLEPTADGTVRGRYVVLVTDGAPNCTNGTLGGGGGGRGGNDAAAIAASVAAIQRMTQQGITTYVLGYDTQAEAELKGALDMMAVAGGTGDREHRAIEDEASLIAAFREITKVAASCEYRLSQAPRDPSYVKVELDGVQINYNAPDGWVLGNDKMTLRLQGAACDRIASGASGKTLSVEVQCEQVLLL